MLSNEGIIRLVIVVFIVAFSLGLVLCPLLITFRSVGFTNQYLMEMKVKVLGIGFEWYLYNPVWNYERLKNEIERKSQNE